MSSLLPLAPSAALTMPLSPLPYSAVTVSDVDVRPLGLAVGVLGVLVTSFYQVGPAAATARCANARLSDGAAQVWVSTVQQALGINSLQLMLKQMPLSAATLLPIILLVGDATGSAPPLSSVVLTPQLLGMIALTAFMAFFVNVSTVYIIAELSPITCVAAGHAAVVADAVARIDSHRLTLQQL
jgi:hypothetical protein